MLRREALRLLAAAATIPLLPRNAFTLFQEVHQQLPGTAGLKALNPHQNATVMTISELIIPQTDTPGAKAARVNEFIDLIIADWYDDEEKSTFLTGLEDVDRRSQNSFSKDFVECSGKQQVQILNDLDDESNVETESAILRRARNAVPEQKHFFSMIKQLTLIGYYTSEIGFVQELHEEIIPARHAGCAPLSAEASK
jgi:glucoside 3-dehydrogenase (cytochrome c) hitch-hiker subunit